MGAVGSAKQPAAAAAAALSMVPMAGHAAAVLGLDYCIGTHQLASASEVSSVCNPFSAFRSQGYSTADWSLGMVPLHKCIYVYGTVALWLTGVLQGTAQQHQCAGALFEAYTHMLGRVRQLRKSETQQAALVAHPAIPLLLPRSSHAGRHCACVGLCNLHLSFNHPPQPSPPQRQPGALYPPLGRAHAAAGMCSVPRQHLCVF